MSEAHVCVPPLQRVNDCVVLTFQLRNGFPSLVHKHSAVLLEQTAPWSLI